MGAIGGLLGGGGGGGLLGGLLGGGGGGGQGGGGGGGGIGGLLGTVAGPGAALIAGIEEKKQKARERRRLRNAVNQAEGQTGSQVFNILNSPEIAAQRNFLQSLFGIPQSQGLPGQPQDDGGLFSGGTNIGGDIFFDSGGGRFGLGKGQLKKGKKLGKRIAAGIQAQQVLEGGVNKKGGQISGRRERRLQRKVERGQGAAQFLSSSPNLRTGAARTIQKRGFGLEQASDFARNVSFGPGGLGGQAPISQPIQEPQDVQGSFPVFGGTSAPSTGDLSGQAFQQFAPGQSVFGPNPGLDPLTQNIDRELQLNLARSGFNQSLAGVGARSFGTGLARTQLQAGLLGQLQSLATLGSGLRDQFLGTNLNLATGRSGLPVGFGPSPFAQAALAGAAQFQ